MPYVTQQNLAYVTQTLTSHADNGLGYVLAMFLSLVECQMLPAAKNPGKLGPIKLSQQKVTKVREALPGLVRTLDIITQTFHAWTYDMLIH